MIISRAYMLSILFLTTLSGILIVRIMWQFFRSFFRRHVYFFFIFQTLFGQYNVGAVFGESAIYFPAQSGPLSVFLAMKNPPFYIIFKVAFDVQE